MAAVRAAEVELLDEAGAVRGRLRVRLLPRDRTDDQHAPLLDLRDAEGLERVQLLEGREYVYELEAGQGPFAFDRPEVFEPDTEAGDRGRLRPGLHTGRLPFAVHAGGRPLGRGAFEVRSRKLDYRAHYRWMLRDVADAAAELVLERFAASEQRLAPEPAGDPAALYQRFAFLQALLESEGFDAAVRTVLGRPHLEFAEVVEERPAGRGLRAGSAAARALAGPGPRRPLEAAPFSAPERLRAARAEAGLDNPPNRLVKHALESWADTATRLELALRAERPTPAVRRGLAEAARVRGRLEALLAEPLFAEVGPLGRVPGSSPVLQQRAGYRELYRAWLTSQAAARLAWAGGEEVYGAGQRDVAALYEYWCFLVVARTVAELAGVRLDPAALIEVRAGGLGLVLARGQGTAVRGTAHRLGRALSLELWFNRTFSPADADGSWTRAMRPDLSLRVQALDAAPPLPPVWVHLDAKYRVDRLAELLGSPEEPPEEGERAGPLREDLLKMHAYRDAIRRSAGAYVLYPGEAAEDLRAYHELLPGLGAFALRPTAAGPADGAGALRRFLDDVLDHLASQATQHERARYWEEVAHAPGTLPRRPVDAAPFLRRPPADTVVLLGHVKSAAHLAWIVRERRYNLRADGRRGALGLGAPELAAELLLLDGPDLAAPLLFRLGGAPELADRGDLLERGYPSPGGARYLLLPLGEALGDGGLPRERVAALRERLGAGRPAGAPLATTWLELVR